MISDIHLPNIKSVFAEAAKDQFSELAAKLFADNELEKVLVSLELLDHDNILKLLEAMPAPVRECGKIKTILLDYPKMNIGGLEKVLQIQSEALVKLGYNVIRVYNVKKDFEYPVGEGIKLVYIPGARADESYWKDMIDVIKENEVDLYWNHSMYDRGVVSKLIMSKMLGVRAFMTLHSFSLRFLQENNAMFYILSRSLKYYDKTVVLDRTSQRFWDSFEANTYYLPHPNPFTPVNEPRKSQSSPFKILWCAHLQLNTKRYIDLPEICYHLKRAGVRHEMVIVGSPVPNEPNALDDINAEADRLDVKDCIKIVPETPEVGKYYSAADCFVLTSSIEGFSLALAEASAFALPIVMYDLPYLSLVRTNKGIITVSYKDTEAVASEIARLAQDAGLYNKASADVLDNIKSFSEEWDQERLLVECIENDGESRSVQGNCMDADSVILFRELVKLQYMAQQQYLAQQQKNSMLSAQLQKATELAEKKVQELEQVIDAAYIMTERRIQSLSDDYNDKIARLEKKCAKLGREKARLKRSRSYRYARFIRRQVRRIKHPLRTLKNIYRRLAKK
jgi:glycosyltransferase involved in cell wall biosynthesis